MFELRESSLFFEGFDSKHPTVVQNLEIVLENISSLNASYHNPKLFILNLNNLLRGVVFFVEQSIKNSPDWLRSCVKRFRDENRKDYETIRYLRNVSAHQKLVFPSESLITGLFRIKSSVEYLVKVGHGSLKNPGSYSWDIAMKNTDEIFHDILVFPYMAFMDVEHSSIGECLGVLRKWFFKVNFKFENTKIDEVIDVYDLSRTFSLNLLDCVCESYAESVGLERDQQFYYELSESNYINTLLELDIYPSLFTQWWESKTNPMNYGVRVNSVMGKSYSEIDEFHCKVKDGLCSTPEEYKGLLIKYRDIDVDNYFTEENWEEFRSFVFCNHWHYKKAFNATIVNTPISPSEIMMIHRRAKVLLSQLRKEKLCTIASTTKEFKEHLDALAKKI